MKKILLLALTVFTLFACGDKNDDNVVPTALLGTWEHEYSIDENGKKGPKIKGKTYTFTNDFIVKITNVFDYETTFTIVGKRIKWSYRLNENYAENADFAYSFKDDMLLTSSPMGGANYWKKKTE